MLRRCSSERSGKMISVAQRPSASRSSCNPHTNTILTMATWACRLLASNEVRWGTVGWSFFIIENTVLSENRTMLRELLGGDDNYHLMYGFFSTIAVGSIGYSFYKLQKRIYKPSQLPPIFVSIIPTGNRIAAWSLTSIGLILASQSLPKMQVPISVVTAVENKHNGSASEGGYKIKVRCPFDFASERRNNSSGDDDGVVEIRGMERVTRHAGLWSLGLVCAGNAVIQSNVGLRLWWMGPSAVAWLGGMHHDSRFRRGIGGHIDPIVDSQTSNIPFLAILSGKQGSSPMASLQDLLSEMKPLNAAMAIVAATLWIVSRGRIP